MTDGTFSTIVRTRTTAEVYYCYCMTVVVVVASEILWSHGCFFVATARAVCVHA